jgi:hypothetical protein
MIYLLLAHIQRDDIHRTRKLLRAVPRSAKAFLWGLVLLLSTIVNAASEDGTKWKEVASWVITKYERTCLASAEYQDGTIVMLSGITVSEGTTLGLSHSRWKSVENGREYPMNVFFDRTRTKATARGRVTKGLPNIVTFDLNSTGVSLFMNSQKMVFIYQDEVVFSADLTGTAAVVAELKNCQRTLGWLPDNFLDPFRR